MAQQEVFKYVGMFFHCLLVKEKVDDGLLGSVTSHSVIYCFRHHPSANLVKAMVHSHQRATNLENACPPSCDDPHVTVIAM